MSITPDFSRALRLLRSPDTIRERCGNIYERVLAGRSNHFTVERSVLPAVAARVAAVTRENYPDLKIPYHSRWNHFHAGGVSRTADLPTDGGSQVALVILSVLLDAGAGPAWKYVDALTGVTLNRSEGLAVASLRMFQAGALSGASGFLKAFSAEQLATGFQVTVDNPLVGLEGRAALIRSLGAAIDAAPDLFNGALGGLFETLKASAQGGELSAVAILDAILRGLSPIWPGRLELSGINLGDVWVHPGAGGDDVTESLVPFHKLSQWLTYSLLEPFEWAGLRVTEIERLTGLAEYRNGGLFVDMGVIVPMDSTAAARAHKPDSEFVVEWRALTVALLDELAPLVCKELGKNLPLANILEGGTWHTGRQVAKERRPDGSPPFRIDSDGTLF